MLGEPVCDGSSVATGGADTVPLLVCVPLGACEPLGVCDGDKAPLLLGDGSDTLVRLADSEGLRDAARATLRDILRVRVSLGDGEPAPLAVELCDPEIDADALCDAVSDCEAEAEALCESEGLPDPLGVSG